MIVIKLYHFPVEKQGKNCYKAESRPVIYFAIVGLTSGNDTYIIK